MTKNLVRLFKLLADLFPDPALSQMVMAEIGMDAGRIYAEQSAKARWLANMLPSFSFDNGIYVSLGDTKLNAEISSFDAKRGQATNFAHVRLLEFGRTLGFAYCSRNNTSPLCVHIGNIVGGCAKKQVRWIAARGIVAFMQNVEAVRNHANVNLPGKAVRESGYAIHSQLSVTCVIPVALPFPTFALGGWRDIFPKSADEIAAKVVVADEATRLAFAVTVGRVIPPGYFRALAASAMAIAVCDFVKRKLGLDKLWGRLLHVVSASNADDQARDADNVAWHFALVSTRSIIPQVSA